MYRHVFDLKSDGVTTAQKVNKNLGYFCKKIVAKKFRKWPKWHTAHFEGIFASPFIGLSDVSDLVGQFMKMIKRRSFRRNRIASPYQVQKAR